MNKPKNYLVESILATILCCMPFGIVGIVFASKVNSEYDAGNYEAAEKASKNAKTWTLVSFGVGIVTIVISIIFGLAGAVFNF